MGLCREKTGLVAVGEGEQEGVFGLREGNSGGRRYRKEKKPTKAREGRGQIQSCWWPFAEEKSEFRGKEGWGELKDHLMGGGVEGLGKVGAWPWLME